MTGVQTCALPICFPVTIWPGSLKDEDDEKIKKVLEVISKYGNSEETAGNTESLTQRERMTAARLGPIMEKGKIAVEAAVITKEIFALVAGFLA